MSNVLARYPAMSCSHGEDKISIIPELMTKVGQNESPQENANIENLHDAETKYDIEALIAMRLALKLMEKGRYSKCEKVFKHAIALDPTNVDLLTNYSDFLEKAYSDYMEADHFCMKALHISPDHPRALSNHARLLPIVNKMDEDQLSCINTRVKVRICTENDDFALTKLNRDVYTQHIYHTLALEGNTISLDLMREILDTRCAISGKSTTECNEVLGLDSALTYLQDVLLNSVTHISIDDILEIHRQVTAFVDPTEAGSFRKIQVFIGRHTPPSSREVPSMMEEFVQWLKSKDMVMLNPVKQAALAHYEFVHIHPFLDGNGRTGRLLMNWILMRSRYPPVIIRKNDQSLYHEYLDMANNGDVRPFVRFIARYVEEVLDSCSISSPSRHCLNTSKSCSKSCFVANGSKRCKLSDIN